MQLIAEVQNLKLPYIMQRRKYGEGEVRLGYALKINPDIYSLSFIMML
jgi:hypothetical protein